MELLLALLPILAAVTPLIVEIIQARRKRQADPRVQVADAKAKADEIIANHDADGINAFVQQRLRSQGADSGDPVQRGDNPPGRGPDVRSDE